MTQWIVHVGSEIPKKIGWLGTTVGTGINKNRLGGYYRRFRNPKKIGWVDTTVGSGIQKKSVGWVPPSVQESMKYGWVDTVSSDRIGCVGTIGSENVKNRLVAADFHASFLPTLDIHN